MCRLLCMEQSPPPVLLILSTLLCAPNGAKLAVGCELNERSVAGGQISHNPP